VRKVLLVCALLAACRKSAPEEPPKAPPPPKPGLEAPVIVKELEPNDYQRAQQIPPRAVVEGTLSAPRDDDWYRVAVTGAPLALRVEVRPRGEAPLQGELEIYDRDRNRLLRVHAPGVIPAVACVESCFVKVSGAGPAPYLLTVLGAPPVAGQELEPNNRAVDANELQPGKPMQGTYLSADDEDWYKLPLPPVNPGDFLRVEVSGVEGVRPELEVRALSDAASLATFRAPAAGAGIFLRNLSLRLGGEPADGGVAPPAGYHLVLKAKGRGAPLSPYTLTATLENGPPDMEVEPNDDAQHATPLQSTASGYLAPAGDQDWYTVHADAGMVMRVEVTGVERADLELSVLDAERKVLARANEGGPKEGEVLPSIGVQAGDSFVLVQAAARNLDGKWVRDGEDRQNPYKLQISLAPDDGSTDREPNNDVATAQEIAVPASVKGWIWPRKDVDMYKFHLAAGHAPVNFRLSAVRGVDLMLRLYELHGAKAEVIGSADSSKGEGEEQILSVPLKEGDYAVEVSSPRHKDASATQPYLLSVQ
jgi:hypothetical protein